MAALMAVLHRMDRCRTEEIPEIATNLHSFAPGADRTISPYLPYNSHWHTHTQNSCALVNHSCLCAKWQYKGTRWRWWSRLRSVSTRSGATQPLHNRCITLGDGQGAALHLTARFGIPVGVLAAKDVKSLSDVKKDCAQIFWGLHISEGTTFIDFHGKKTRTCPMGCIGCVWFIHSGRTIARWCVARRSGLKHLLDSDPRFSDL